MSCATSRAHEPSSAQGDAGGRLRAAGAITPITDTAASSLHALRFSQEAAVQLSSLGVASGDWLDAFLHLELSAWNH